MRGSWGGMRIRPCALVMTGVGPNRIAVMAALREVRSDLSLRDAKVFLENLPQVVLRDVDLEEAERAAAILGHAGAEGRTEKPDLSTRIEDWLKKKCTVEEIKALDESSAAQSGRDSSDCSHLWEELEKHMRPGDTVWTYSSPDVFWINMCGRAGYAIVRDGKVIHTVLTAMN